MARKTKTAVQNLAKRIVRSEIRRRGGCGAIFLVIVLALIGLVNPEWRDKIANIAAALPGIQNENAPLPSKKQSPLKEGIWQVVHISDGDTLDVRDDEGVTHRVRLIGADTPETVKPNSPVQPFGQEASAFTKNVITKTGGKVRIAFDGDQIDKYGRNLAMVYLQTPKGEIWLNELLIREGLARALLQYRFSKGAKSRLQAAENQAKAARRNIWSKNTK
jgi:micrococcal nuclease